MREKLTSWGAVLSNFSHVQLLPGTLDPHSPWIIQFGRNASDFFDQAPAVFNDYDVSISWCFLLFGLWTKTQKEKYGRHIMDDDHFSIRRVSLFRIG
ncbi:hypothetical protein ABC336_21065 [Paenibacillus sp. 1P07SE]